MFRPDDMCQKIVKLYLDLQEDIAKKQFKKKYESIVSAVESTGENINFAKGLSYLIFFFYFNYHPKPEMVHNEIGEVEDYRQMLALFKKLIDRDTEFKFTTGNFVEELKSLLNEDIMEIDDFYYFVAKRGNLVPNANKTNNSTTPYQRSFFLCLLHMIFLQSMHKTYEGTFSERLTKSN